MNFVCFDARLARDSETKETTAGPITTMRVVHNSWSKAHGEKPNFFTVKVWKAQDIPKGTAIMVEGKLEEYSYDKDGEKRSYVTINAHKVTPIQFIKLDAPPSRAAQVQGVFGSPPPASFEDGVPF